MSALTQPMAGGAAAIPTVAEMLDADPDGFVQKYTDIAAINLACAVGLPKADGLDIPACLRALDAMAHWVKRKTGSSWHLFNRVPAEFQRSKNAFRVYIMLHHLHKHFGVRYNPERRDLKNDDPTDSGDEFIHGILSERRTGTCASLPVFAVAVGRRLSYPLKLVKVPRHLICRWHDESEQFNIDFKGDGASIKPDEEYQKWPVRWDAKRRWEYEQGLWLRSLSARQDASLCLHSRALVQYYAERDLPEALACVDAAERFNPGRRSLYDILRGAIQDKIRVGRILLTAICAPGELESPTKPHEVSQSVFCGTAVIVDQSVTALGKWPQAGGGPVTVSEAARAMQQPPEIVSGRMRPGTDSKPHLHGLERRSVADIPFPVCINGRPVTRNTSTKGD
jgi:Transglutaminase-like superfamily